MPSAYTHTYKYTATAEVLHHKILLEIAYVVKNSSSKKVNAPSDQRVCDCKANWLHSSREMLYFSANVSAVIPIGVFM